MSCTYDEGRSYGWNEVANCLEREVGYLKELEDLLGIKIISK